MNRFNTLLYDNPFTSRIAQFLSENPLYKSVAVIGSGAILAQLLGILTVPIITRLYTPADLGIFTIYFSILSIVVGVASLRYEFAYTLPKQDEAAANLLVLCLVLLVFTTTAFALIILFLGDVLIHTFHWESLSPYLILLIPGFFGMALYSILNYWAVRRRDYRRITYTNVNQSVGGVASKILLGLFSCGPLGLITGQIVSLIVGIGTFSRSMWKTERENLNLVSVAGIKSVAKEYWSFPAFNLPASIVNTLSLQLPPLVLLTMYGSQTVGLYALAYGLLVLPGSFISTSLSQAFLGEVSKMVREDSLELRSLYVKTIKHLSLVAIPSIGILSLIAPLVTPVVFGASWIEAGWYCLPLALVVIPQFIVSPTSRLTIYGYNHWSLMWDVTRVCGVLAGFYISQFYGFSVILTLTIYAVVLLVMYLFNIILNLKAISNFTAKATSVKSKL